MKKKILTLLVLLMTAVTGAWAQDSEPAPIDLTYDATAGTWNLASMPAYDVELEVEYEPGFVLTLAEGSEAHGTVALTISDQAVTEAYKDDVVTVTITPEEGYVVTAITAEAYTTWNGSRRNTPGTIPVVDMLTLTPVEGVANAWTFQMPAANVELAVSYAQAYTLTVAAERFATFFAAENVKLDPQTPEDVTLHTITAVGDAEATVSTSLEGVIAAETPLLVYNGTEQEQTVTLIPTMEAATAAVTWAAPFKGTAKDSTFTAADMQAADYYALSGGKAFAMVYGAGTLKANQCWLQFDKQQVPGARLINLVFGEATGINSLTPDPSRGGEGSIYSLDGRRVQFSMVNGQWSMLKKGVYVKNGRKVVIK